MHRGKLTLATDIKLTNELAIMFQEKELIGVVKKFPTVC